MQRPSTSGGGPADRNGKPNPPKDRKAAAEPRPRTDAGDEIRRESAERAAKAAVRNRPMG